MGGMIGIQRDHRLRIQRVGQGGIPALQGHLRQEQPLAVGQDRALGEPEDPAHGHRPHMSVFLPDGHAFDRTGGSPDRIRLRMAALCDGLQVMAPAVPFHQKGDRRTGGLPARGVVTGDGLGEVLAMESGVEAHQQGGMRQLQGPGQNPIQGGIRRLGAVLGAFSAAPCRYTSPPAPDTPQWGGIAHKARIRPANALLAGIRVVQGEDIHVQSHPATGQGRDGHLGPLHQLQQGFVHQRQKLLGTGIQSLAHGGTRQDGPQTQAFAKEPVFPKALDGVEIALALTQQSQVGNEHIAVGDAAADRETGIDELSQLGKAGDGLADQCQTAQGGQRLVISCRRINCTGSIRTYQVNDEWPYHPIIIRLLPRLLWDWSTDSGSGICFLTCNIKVQAK